jgi:hypothetical protein
MDISNDSVVAHTTCIIKRSGAADQHFLGITAAQRAGTSKGAKINDCNLPAGGAHAHCRSDCRCTRTNDYQVVLFSHFFSGFFLAGLFPDIRIESP